MQKFFRRWHAALVLLRLSADRPWRPADSARALPSAETPKNVLVIGHVAELQTLDPAQSVTISDFRLLYNVYDSLLHYKDGSLEVEPGLANSWTVSPDGKTYTFNLRKGVKFHDGTDFNADAVKFNLDRVTRQEPPLSQYRAVPLHLPPRADRARPRSSDPMTVAIHLRRPMRPCSPMLAERDRRARRHLARGRQDNMARNSAAMAAARGRSNSARWDSGQRFVLEANKDYWRGAPKLDGLVFRPIIDENARVSEMLSGGTDITIEVPPDNVANFKDSREVHLLRAAGAASVVPCAQHQGRSLSTTSALRQAIELRHQQGRDGQPDSSRERRRSPPADAAGLHLGAMTMRLKPYPYDPAKAKALLADAGYPNGVDVTFYVTESGSGMLSPMLMGTAIQADLEAVGIRAKIETYEWNTFLGKIIPGMQARSQIAELSFMTQDPDMHPALALRTGGAVNSGGYSNPKVDALIDAGPRRDPIPQSAPRSTSSCRRSSPTTRLGCSSPTGSRTRYPRRIGERASSCIPPSPRVSTRSSKE